MAEDHLKRSASFGSTRREEPSFEEDPLVELARIVAEDGGFYRHGRAPELKPARNEPARHEALSPEELLANQLEAELMQNIDVPERGPDVAHRRPMTELRAFGGTPEAPPAHVPLRQPAGGGQHHQSSRFPHFLIEDARPHAAVPMDAAPGPQADQWREADRASAEVPAERFEDEFEASYVEVEMTEPAESLGSGFGTAGEGSAEFADPAHAEFYSTDYDEPDPYPDDVIAEQDDATAPPPERRAPVRGPRSYKGLLAAAGVLGVVVLGGAVAAMIGSDGPGGDVGPPPVIKAESGPAKVAAEGTEQAQAGDGAGQAVYDRVAGRAPKSDEKLVDRSEEPRQVSRVVLPQADGASVAGGDPASDGSAAETQPDGAASDESIAGQISSDTPALQSGPRIDPVGPRRVRTVTVKPDGTIVSNADPVRVAEASTQPSGPVEMEFGADAPEPVSVRTVTVDTDESPSGPLAGEAAAPRPDNAGAPQPLVQQAERGPADSPATESVPETASAETDDAAEPAAATETDLAMLPRARPNEVPAAFVSRAAAAPSRQSQPAQRQAAAPSRSGEPVDLLAASPASPRAQAQPAQAASRPAAAASASPYAVQLSAQRSEDQARAAFAGLKSQFPSVLGSRDADIERADLGDRGIYYRVRVGAGSQAEANQLCDQLKAAGGSCFVAR